MRDYDPSTGRYIQADPLGLVDGASVYGYALQSPGRYTDPRGEFGVIGAAIGAVSNFGFQFGTGLLRYGLSNYHTALRCVDFSKVATSAAFGAIGASPFKIIRSGGKLRSVAGVAGVKWWTDNITTPVIRIGDECECKADDGFGGVRKRILNFLDSFFL